MFLNNSGKNMGLSKSLYTWLIKQKYFQNKKNNIFNYNVYANHM